MRQPYKTILFDLDGTVLDTISMIVESLRHALETHLRWVPDHDALIAGVGTPLVDQMRAHVERWSGAPAPGALVTTLAQTYIAHNLATHDTRVTPYPGAEETLDGLRAAGVRLGIVTSKPQATARRGLRVCGLESYFEVVVGADDVARPKPDAEPVLLALGALRADAATAVFVGDSPHDMLSGRAAAVDTGAAMWGPFARATLAPTTPSHWLDEIRHLLQLV